VRAPAAGLARTEAFKSYDFPLPRYKEDAQMTEFEGLDKLTRQLEEASRAFQSLGGELAAVTVVPGDRASVQAAIQQVEAMIDQKAKCFEGNELVDSMVRQIKKRYRAELIRRGRVPDIEF